MPNASRRLRALPSVERLVHAVQAQPDPPNLPRALLVDTARAVLAETRQQIRAAPTSPAGDLSTLAATVQARLAALAAPSLRPVINASGVLLQTNLGRAPLSRDALAAMQAVGAGYTNLEYNLEAGQRGSRATHLAGLLCQLTGAEAALAVNNNAAAVYLALLALAAGREVVVSRGQAVEIGGGFRIPDVLRQSGATLREVGTTNRTYARDYAAAVGTETGLLLRVHTSNFRLLGFVHETSLADLAAVGRAHSVPVLDDLGSGTLLPTTPYGLHPEPTVPESIAAGADLVTFSGDKLLGGPQAGLIVGRADLVAQLARHPLARALRLDKTTIAALHATLLAYVQGTALDDIPIWQMISAPLEAIQARAAQLATHLTQHGHAAQVCPCESAVGGGALPGDTLPSMAVALTPAPPQSADALAHALRTGSPAVVPRIAEGRVLLDMRSVLPQQDAALRARLLGR